MVEDSEGLESSIGTVLELESQELAGLGGSTTAEFDGDDRSKVGNSLQLRVFRGDLSLVEEGDERLVSGLDDHHLKRVAVKSDTLKSSDDTMGGGSAGNVSNSVDVVIREDGVLPVICQTTDLLKESRGEAMSVGLVMD